MCIHDSPYRQVANHTRVSCITSRGCLYSRVTLMETHGSFAGCPSPYSRICLLTLKHKNTPFELVWVVMQLTPLVVTTLASPLTLLYHINRGREVHEMGLEFLHCYAGGIGTLFAHTFALEVFPLCCRAGRLSSLEKRSSRSRSRFREVPT